MEVAEKIQFLKQRLLTLIDKLTIHQTDCIKKIIRATKKKKYIAINAPTGFGKTLVAITAALYLSLKGYITVISVRTRNEIHPYIRDFTKFLDETPAVLLCKYETCPRYRAQISTVLPCGTCKHRVDPNLLIDNTSIYREIVKISKENRDLYTLTQKIYTQLNMCPHYIFRYLYLANNMPIIVCTYPYITRLYPILHEDLRAMYGEAPRALIVDEAHNIESDMFTVLATITENDLKATIRETEKYVKPHLPEEATIVQEVAKLLLDIITELRTRTKRGEVLVDTAELLDILREIDTPETLLEATTKAEEKIREHYRRRLLATGKLEVTPETKKLADFLDALLLDEDTVAVYSNDTDSLDIRLTRIDLPKMFSDFSKIILLSGTLQPKTYITAAWRIPREEIEYLDYTHVKIGKIRIYIDTSVTTRYAERIRDLKGLALEYGRRIHTIYRKIAKKHVLTVTPSYELAELFADAVIDIEPELENKIIVENEHTKIGEIEKEARERKNTRLLIIAVAGGKLTEGIELVDEQGKTLISDIIIAGVPYRPPTPFNMLIETILTRETGLTREYIRNVKALVLVRQALGRGARRPDDKVNWWLLDYRFTDDFWWKHLISTIATEEETRILTDISLEV